MRREDGGGAKDDGRAGQSDKWGEQCAAGRDKGGGAVPPRSPHAVRHLRTPLGRPSVQSAPHPGHERTRPRAATTKVNLKELRGERRQYQSKTQWKTSRPSFHPAWSHAREEPCRSLLLRGERGAVGANTVRERLFLAHRPHMNPLRHVAARPRAKQSPCRTPWRGSARPPHPRPSGHPPSGRAEGRASSSRRGDDRVVRGVGGHQPGPRPSVSSPSGPGVRRIHLATRWGWHTAALAARCGGARHLGPAARP